MTLPPEWFGITWCFWWVYKWGSVVLTAPLCRCRAKGKIWPIFCVVVSVSSRSRTWKSWSRSRSCDLQVSVSLKAISRDHRYLKILRLKKLIILKMAKWGSKILIKIKIKAEGSENHILWCVFLFGWNLCLGYVSKICGYDCICARVPGVLPLLVDFSQIWGLGLGLDLGFQRSRSRKGWSWSRKAWPRSWSRSRMVRSRSSITLTVLNENWSNPNLIVQIIRVRFRVIIKTVWNGHTSRHLSALTAQRFK